MQEHFSIASPNFVPNLGEEHPLIKNACFLYILNADLFYKKISERIRATFLKFLNILGLNLS